MKLAAFPKCFMDHIVVERSMSLFDWIAMAADLPIEGVEFHHGFFETLEANYLERVRSALEGRGLAVAHVTVGALDAEQEQLALGHHSRGCGVGLAERERQPQEAFRGCGC